MALAPRLIDAGSFTLIRLGAGALMLGLLVGLQDRGWAALRGGSLTSGLALFAYAAPFTFAYLRIGAAVGALLLFGAVQLTMFGWGIIKGERPSPRVWVGLVLAAAGLSVLLLPAATRPDVLGSMLMVGAGIAWGIYSLRGRAATNALASNARNFLLATPLALLVALLQSSRTTSPQGIALAAISGAVTSGLGYAAWYRALPHLPASAAAIVQLSVPVIAGLGAVVLLDERLSSRLVMATLLVIGGVALALAGRSRDAARLPNQPVR
jgi:drug/metabolite transporter (DMT)-like permease